MDGVPQCLMWQTLRAEAQKKGSTLQVIDVAPVTSVERAVQRKARGLGPGLAAGHTNHHHRI